MRIDPVGGGSGPRGLPETGQTLKGKGGRGGTRGRTKGVAPEAKGGKFGDSRLR